MLNQSEGHTEILVEIILGFLSKPSTLQRKLSEQVFASFAPSLTSAGLKLLLNVMLTPETASGVEDLFDNSLEDEMDDEVEDESEEEDGSDKGDDEDEDDYDDEEDEDDYDDEEVKDDHDDEEVEDDYDDEKKVEHGYDDKDDDDYDDEEEVEDDYNDEEDEEKRFGPWDPSTRRGWYTDIKDVRIFGSQWYGTSVANELPELCDALARNHRAGAGDAS